MEVYGVVMQHDKDLTNFDHAQYVEKSHDVYIAHFICTPHS